MIDWIKISGFRVFPGFESILKKMLFLAMNLDFPGPYPSKKITLLCYTDFKKRLLFLQSSQLKLTPINNQNEPFAKLTMLVY